MITSDVLAVLPSFVKAGDSAPVRDALVAFLVETFNAYEAAADYASAQSDPLRNTGIYLRGLAEDHEIFAGPDETDTELRARIFSFVSVASPAAIIAAVNAIVSPHTAILPQVFEADSDCAFITDGSAAYDSAFIGVGPRYPDRLYLDDAVENGGSYRPQSDPGGFWVFGDQLGRFFVIRLPALDAADTDFSFASSSDPDEMFISNNANANGSELDGSVISFGYADTATSVELYNSVVGVVERIAGQGMRFEVYVDPTLS